MKCSVSKHHQHPRKWLTRTCTVLSFCVDLDESIAKRRFYAFLVDRWIWRLDSQCRQSSFEAKIGILFSPFDEGFERSLLARCTGHQSHLSPERFWPPALETEREGVSRWHHVFADRQISSLLLVGSARERTLSSCECRVWIRSMNSSDDGVLLRLIESN